MDLSRPSPDNPSPLQGKRIVLTAIDLEQSEHRGIAVYSKALIKILREAGAEVWLLTQFDTPKKDPILKRLPKATQVIIQSSKVLNSLATGREPDDSIWIEGKSSLFRKARRIFKLLLNAWELLRRPRKYKRNQVREIHLNTLFDNPNLRHERLGYLNNVEGLLCARKVFFASQIAALLKRQKPVQIDLEGFDAFITSCPLNILPQNVPIFIQTVHDLIALEYAPHNENTLLFSHRLQACIPARRIYVSQSTAIKFKNHILIPTSFNKSNIDNKYKSNFESILVQPPSLIFPEWLIESESMTCDLRPTSYFLRNETDLNLEPFKYLLFNSSVEERKNLLFLVKAYAASDLGGQGIKLCVTGKLKKDSYSKEVREIVKNEPAILLTGYIDESTKLDLYLNSLALLSPSLVEGFGIPALDAACLGMPAIVSDCESHHEIKSMHDFYKYILTVNTLETREWATAMESVVGTSKEIWNRAAEERKRRIKRYKNESSLMKSEFQNELIKLIK